MKEKRKSPRFNEKTEDAILTATESILVALFIIATISLMFAVFYALLCYWQARVILVSICALVVLVLFVLSSSIKYRRWLASKQDDNLS